MSSFRSGFPDTSFCGELQRPSFELFPDRFDEFIASDDVLRTNLPCHFTTSKPQRSSSYDKTIVRLFCRASSLFVEKRRCSRPSKRARRSTRRPGKSDGRHQVRASLRIWSYSYSMAAQTATMPIVDRGGSQDTADRWDRFEYEYRPPRRTEYEYEYEKRHEQSVSGSYASAGQARR